jgi:hypothetical protein
MDRMSKPSLARYRTTNWSSYTASLRKRGSLPIWLDKEMTWLAQPDGSPGRPAMFSDAAIQFCLTIMFVFKLPLRQTTGSVADLLKVTNPDWSVPEKTTPRPKALAFPYRRAEAQDHATQWLWTYNNDRPNMGIGGITLVKKLKMAT